jgi:putative peptidoglycan lipid II flippase
MLDSATRIMLLIFLPITVMTCILAEPIVAVVYQRGEFDAASARLVARALFWLAPSMSFLAVEMLLMRHFFSRLDVWTPTLVGVGCTGARVALIYLLIGHAGLAGVAAAITASRALKVAILLGVLHRARGTRQRQARGIGRTVAEATKLGVATVVSAVSAFAVAASIGGSPDSSMFGRIGLMAAAGSMGAVAYAVTLAVLWQGKFREMILWESEP